MSTSKGFTDKLYWREAAGLFHCFKKQDSHTFLSLCARFTLTRVHSQAIQRPKAEVRCPLCDGKEMQRRGWDESGEATQKG